MEAWLSEMEQQLTRVMDGLRWPFSTLTGLLLASLVLGWALWLRGRRARVRTLFSQRRREEAEAQREEADARTMEAETRIAQARRNLGEHRVWTEAPQLLTTEERQQIAAHQQSPDHSWWPN
jgi:hypothetical protein